MEMSPAWEYFGECISEKKILRGNSGYISILYTWQFGQKCTWPPPTLNFSIGASHTGQGCCFMLDPMAGV